ncbi:MAG: hypothetical protein JSW00_01145 [Thermoplasmata archaeon]|nr:MAG: hypothetical protein JSW00_01145 [Thermoplasmata archaeon]
MFPKNAEIIKPAIINTINGIFGVTHIPKNTEFIRTKKEKGKNNSIASASLAGED